MSAPHVWQLIQRWMDGQVIRVNQSQLASAIGVGRQTITQWKRGETRPSPDNLRRLSEVTRIPYSDLTDALLRDLGYVIDREAGEDRDHTASIGDESANVSPAESANSSHNVTPMPTAEALDPTMPEDVAARSEEGKGRAQAERERQDEEGEQ